MKKNYVNKEIKKERLRHKHLKRPEKRMSGQRKGINYHRLPYQEEMKILESNLRNDIALNDYAFQNFHKELIRDIKTVGDEQFRVTNLKAQTTRWNMAKDFKSFKELLDVIVKHHLKYYIQDGPFMGNLDVVCPDMWGSIYKKGDYAIEHSHNPADISFVYYVKATKDCSPIIFTEPAVCSFQPKEGMLLIWDAKYKHMVPESIIDEERIVIAGNFAWKTRHLGVARGKVNEVKK